MNTDVAKGRASSKDTVRIAAISDLHCRRDSKPWLRPVFEQIAGEADILVVCGDITDWGRAGECEVFLKQAAPVLQKIPVLAVLGNHDVESGKQDELVEQLLSAGVSMLDGNSLTVGGVGFTGVKGFGGGFGKMAVQPLGEGAVKNFVSESVLEAQKLEAGLSALNQKLPRIALLHYAPIRETVAGEPLELFPFLGSSGLEEPVNKYAATAVFHGHAHAGSLEGKTSANVPVYNVCASVLKKRFPGRPPFFVLDVPVGSGVSPQTGCRAPTCPTGCAGGRSEGSPHRLPSDVFTVVSSRPVKNERGFS
ncbi:MAG: metallophosphoesterase [Syntrophobacteraceae bacterium]|nr:metallophosphoesterase [Syntrophobacteraceae bacterium]